MYLRRKAMRNLRHILLPVMQQMILVIILPHYIACLNISQPWLLTFTLYCTFMLTDMWRPGKKFRRQKGKRRDRVDVKYRDVYRKWKGPKFAERHPSTIPAKWKNIISPLQHVPGYCVICPKSKEIYNHYDLKRHYKHMHRNGSYVVNGTTLLRCKCSDIKSQGTDNYNRNAHYHCHLCQWPKKDREQLGIHLSSKHSLPFEEISHLFREPKKAKKLFLAKEEKKKSNKEEKGNK